MAAERSPLLSRETEAWRFTLCLAGIVGTLGLYGFLQERIMVQPYDGVFFGSSMFLVLFNRVFGAVFACLFAWESPHEKHERAPLWKYFAISASNVLASAFQYEALKFVAFAVQMVGKSAKMLPVMIWGVTVSAKHYKRSDWVVALVVSAGCLCFLLGGDLVAARAYTAPGADHEHAYHLLGFGLLLTAAAMACDGFTSVYQERLFEEYRMSQWEQMLYTNLCSTFLAVVVLAATGGFAESVLFSYAHPAFAQDVLLLSVAAAAGQVCIYTTIAWFGAVVFAAALNVRQVASITLSTLYFGHPFCAAQCVGVVLTFGALGWRTWQHWARPLEEKAVV